MIDVNVAYKMTVAMVSALSNIGENPTLFEACDFGDSYGFLFYSPDKYTNQYWCVNKKTGKPYNFTENMDFEKYKNRRVIAL
jgi:hypothetical protein